MTSERVQLADGPAVQGVLEAVPARSESAILLELHKLAKARRRGAAPMPEGGLFDEVARAQLPLL